MAIGKAGGANAALFAAAILGLKYPPVQQRLSAFRARRRKEALDNQVP